MPIVGLTTNKVARLNGLGVLRKGKPKAGGKLGPDLGNQFRFDPGNDSDLAQAFEEVYGAEPNHLTVYLPYRTAAENFEAWKEDWGAGSLKHRCDGEFCWEYQRGQLVKTEKPCPGNCRQVGRLSVVLPDLVTHSKRFGTTTVLTSSKWDLATITELLNYYEMLSGGDLRGIPFILSRKPRMVSVPPYGNQTNRSRAEKWLIHLESAPEWVSHRLESVRRHALGVGLDMPALTDSEHEQDDDDTIEAEYQQVNPVTGEIPESVDFGSLMYDALREAEARGIAYDFTGVTLIQVQDHIKLWRRFVEVVIPAAQEVGVIGGDVDLNRYNGLSYDDLKTSALKAVDLIKTKILETLGSEVPQSTKIEDWLTAWREVFTRKPDF